MKKKINPFTETEIRKLKTAVKINYIAQKYGLSKKSNHAYRIMRNGVKTENSKAYEFMRELKNILQEVQNN